MRAVCACDFSERGSISGSGRVLCESSKDLENLARVKGELFLREFLLFYFIVDIYYAEVSRKRFSIVFTKIGIKEFKLMLYYYRCILVCIFQTCSG